MLPKKLKAKSPRWKKKIQRVPRTYLRMNFNPTYHLTKVLMKLPKTMIGVTVSLLVNLKGLPLADAAN